MEKKISYLARNFEDIKNELILFTKKYYPNLTDSLNDASIGAWLVDLISAVGDDLSYHTDRVYQETNIDTANSKNTILNNARMNGVKILGPKPSICEVELSCTLDVKSDNIAQPDWNQAPILRRGSIVGNSNYNFELTEDVNFGEQFNTDGVSNRKFTPIKNSNGVITGYRVTKSTMVISGRSKVYKKVLSDDDITPFMEIVLPEQNIMNVESILFKETSSFNTNPQTYEYYIDEEEFKLNNEDVSTYRYFEVTSLADQYRFGTETRWVENENAPSLTIDEANPEIYEYYNTNQKDNTTVTPNEATCKYFRGIWKPISQKFVTEYTVNGYLKVIFGCGTDSIVIPSGGTHYGEYVTSKIINNRMLGLLPRAGWTMFVLYRVGGGIETNLAANSINKIISMDAVFPHLNNDDTTVKNEIIQSFTVSNPSPSVAGKDAPSNEEMKYLIKYTIPSQERCVTLKDYKARIMAIPPKYGCPFRCNVMEDNNKIVIPLLGLSSTQKLDSTLPLLLVHNLVEYLKNYRSINDYLEFKSGRIYNIGIAADAFIDKNYTTSAVVSELINTITEYFSVNNHDMGEDIFVGDLEKQLNMIDGVISLIDLRIYKIWGGKYSSTPCPLPTIQDTNACNSNNVSFTVNGDNGASTSQIDLNAVDAVLYSDYDSMYEILNPDSDIQIRVKLR